MKTAAQRIQTADTIELVPQILHLKKILVPTDFSETSKKAVQYALRFAEQFGCEIALLYVVEPATPMIGAPLGVEPFTEKDEFSIAEKDLAVLAAESHTTGAHSVSSLVRVGHAPNEITKAAKDLDVDLIIISTHGYTSWQHFCIGSTTERVVRTAPCPGTRRARKRARVRLDRSEELMNPQIINHEIQIEPLATRVALSSFFGRDESYTTHAADGLCGGETFQRKPDDSPRRRVCEWVLSGRDRQGSARVSGRLWRIDPNTNRWRRRFARVVMDVSAVRLAIYSTRDRTDHCALFLRGNPAGILREGPLVRLRASEADQRRDGDALAGCA